MRDDQRDANGEQGGYLRFFRIFLKPVKYETHVLNARLKRARKTPQIELAKCTGKFIIKHVYIM